MLVLGDSSIGNVLVAIIDDRVALIIPDTAEHLEIQCAIGKSAFRIVEPGVQWTAVEDMIEFALALHGEACAQMHGDTLVIQDALDDLCITVLRHALVFVIEVVVVVIESQWQALEDTGGQVAGVDTPLLQCIALKEGLVDIPADETQRLLLKRSGFDDGAVGDIVDIGARLSRPEGLAEELIDSEQVDRQRKDLALRNSFDAVDIGHEFREPAKIIPHFLIVGVEDMRAIDMHHNPGFGITRRMAITGHVVASFEDLNIVAMDREFPCNNGS